MQIVCICKYCHHHHVSDKDADLTIEFDGAAEEIRFVCRNKDCRKNNTISFAPRKNFVPLPKTVIGRG